MKVKVVNMTTSGGNQLASQLLIYTDDGETYFQSYNTIIAKIGSNGKVTLDEDYWDYSNTTNKYRNVFLGEGIAETRKKIASGEYVLRYLNSTMPTEEVIKRAAIETTEKLYFVLHENQENDTSHDISVYVIANNDLLDVTSAIARIRNYVFHDGKIRVWEKHPDIPRKAAKRLSQLLYYKDNRISSEWL